MKYTDVTDTNELRQFMTTPTDGLIEMMKTLDGDVLILGGGGKVGPELVETMVRADEAAGVKRTYHVADLFPDPKDVSQERLCELGCKVVAGDLTDQAFIDALPAAKNVIFMVGFKFGSSKDYRLAFHINAVLPYLIGVRFPTSRIVAFTSANPYPHTRPADGGSKETDEVAPQGVYGWGIIARESALRTTQLKNPDQTVAFYRLAYAQHLGYGVLVDLAKMVLAGEEISLGMPYVNLISQRDAIDASIRLLSKCDNPAFTLNVAGPPTPVRWIVGRIGELMGVEPKLLDDEADTALLANDDLCVSLFGPYRDGIEEMIQAAVNWVKNDGEYWNKPTLFGRVRHDY